MEPSLSVVVDVESVLSVVVDVYAKFSVVVDVEPHRVLWFIWSMC